ncbi:MAG: nucleotidyltransferase family protein, partial [Opitutaceae bacterium]|nr:nucleotidyltransferase family protein [Opitutaceae bacterium]
MNVQHRDTPRLGYDDGHALPRSCWPTTTQRLLLQACLGGPELTRNAFRAWHARVDVFKLDHGSNRLMALLYRNLERAGVRAPEHDVLKGNWRYHWYLNKSRMREFAKLQEKLAAVGVPVVAMKGIPLVAFYYEDIGVRPMADIDVLVRRSDAKAAVECMLEDGYRLNFPFKDEHIATKNGRTFVKQGATEVDMHWCVLHDFNIAWSDEALWSGSQTRAFDGMTLRFLRAEDQILHLCSHGMRYNVVAPLRWLADVAMVLRREGHRLDLDYLLREAGRREMINPVKLTFAWLEKYLDLPCAPLLRRGVRRMNPPWEERLDYFWRAYPVNGLPG